MVTPSVNCRTVTVSMAVCRLDIVHSTRNLERESSLLETFTQQETIAFLPKHFKEA